MKNLALPKQQMTMPHYCSTLLARFPFALVALVLFGNALVTTTAAQAETMEQLRDRIVKEIPDAKKELVALTPQGPMPASIEIGERDSSVFFLNRTPDALLSLEIDFGTRRVHCWSPNFKPDETGKMKTLSPIAPRDFAITCFPEAGTYSYIVRGLPSKPSGVRGEVVIR